jgi:hypothetical protein
MTSWHSHDDSCDLVSSVISFNFDFWNFNFGRRGRVNDSLPLFVVDLQVLKNGAGLVGWLCIAGTSPRLASPRLSSPNHLISGHPALQYSYRDRIPDTTASPFFFCLYHITAAAARSYLSRYRCTNLVWSAAPKAEPCFLLHYIVYLTYLWLQFTYPSPPYLHTHLSSPHLQRSIGTSRRSILHRLGQVDGRILSSRCLDYVSVSSVCLVHSSRSRSDRLFLQALSVRRLYISRGVW